MPSSPKVRFSGRQRAVSAFGDPGRLVAGKARARKAKKAKRTPPHRFIYWKVGHAGVCSCRKWMLTGVNREQGEAAWRDHLIQARRSKPGAG